MGFVSHGPFLELPFDPLTPPSSSRPAQYEPSRTVAKINGHLGHLMSTRPLATNNRP